MKINVTHGCGQLTSNWGGFESSLSKLLKSGSRCLLRNQCKFTAIIHSSSRRVSTCELLDIEFHKSLINVALQ